MVRQQDLLGAEDRWQGVAYSTSIASGQDLADFWEHWGVEVAEEHADPSYRSRSADDPRVNQAVPPCTSTAETSSRRTSRPSTAER